MRYLIGFIFLFSLGCESIIPGPTRMKAPEFNDDQIILAVEIGKVSSPTPSPTPLPDKVKVGDKCPTCYGTGKSGDGIKDCRDCKGDGVVNEGDPVLVEMCGDTILPTPGDIIQQIILNSLESLENDYDKLCTQVANIEKKIATKDPIKETAPQKKVTKYKCKYQGKEYIWDEKTNKFIAFDGATVWFTNPKMNPTNQEFIQFCKYGFCTPVPIEAYTEIDDGSIKGPSNDTGSK